MLTLRTIAAASVLVVASQVAAENLDAAAARELERRQEARRKASTARVLTEEDLSRTRGRLANDPTPPAPSPPATSAPSSRSTEGVGSDLRQREAFWRQEARRRRAEMTRAEKALEAVERWSDPTYVGKDRPSCSITRARERQQARAHVDRARRSLLALDDEARVAGALPGWIRE